MNTDRRATPTSIWVRRRLDKHQHVSEAGTRTFDVSILMGLPLWAYHNVTAGRDNVEGYDFLQIKFHYSEQKHKY